MRRALHAVLGAALAAFLAMSAWGDTAPRILPFDQLTGWAEDDHNTALAVFKETCDRIKDPDWAPICGIAQAHSAGGRAFFEALFRPVLFGGTQTALFTGYFEPELDGSRARSGGYRWALHRRPAGLALPWASRGEIERGGLLSGYEIVWVDDPVEKYFLQIQGSGRVRLTDGSVLRVGYGGQNGHPYRSVGQELIRRGIFNRHQVSAARIKQWVRRNPQAGRALLWHNPSYVFFREVTEVPAEKGPLGAMVRSITAMRSVAVDPSHVPLGAPVWIEKAGRDPLRRLMVAQDTGGAIKGVQRADIFFGTGDEAGTRAGRVRDPGRMVLLLPIAMAHALDPQG